MSNIGYCKYCGNGRVVELPEGVSQEALDQEASATCNCYRAMEARKKETQREVCIAQLGEMLHEKHPEIEEILVSAIDALQEGKFEKITINTGFNKTIRMRMTKDGIKIEIERKMKEENLA